MFGQLGNIAGLMKQAKEMQSKMKEMQEAVANARFEAESGAGAVKATVSGKMELVALTISPETVKSGDVEMLEDLVKSAVCAAQRKAADGMREEMQKMTGGLNLPGLEGLMGQ
ncbi:MAG: YbaB/EbfC family nucleoid-associated protein [Planctomycetia bacterium]|nr:YbaB/EbfC family nucleoid-associated protein [Planctomycetia bacterium]MCC7314968.1 YbaB/EbfC family nucleoid-associated protein [Planctomycetota bacterium]OQZ05289.1 MAG: YbaB/EbfC family nucleoid-associated protein [Planctomycetes bacterium UTPLA1]